jgi:2-polyprenyl-3-methyl-5-hydroxy-6-metoxy-1,4-benzoquinol methylase
MLDIGFPSPVMSAALRECGGQWSTIARSPEDARDFEACLASPVCCLEANGAIPFQAHAFDVAVIALDVLAAVEDKAFFLRECNRVLNTTGELVISTQFRQRFGIINLKRDSLEGGNSLFGHSLSESEIYKFMKPGFDVLGIAYFSNFFTELARMREEKLLAGGLEEEAVSAAMKWRYWFAGQLDFFAFLRRGHIATVHARRKRWRERSVPMLADGRSMQEAVFMKD